MTGDLFSPPLLSVKEKLTADPDSEIATTSLRVSLMCPVGFYIFVHFSWTGLCEQLPALPYRCVGMLWSETRVNAAAALLLLKSQL